MNFTVSQSKRVSFRSKLYGSQVVTMIIVTLLMSLAVVVGQSPRTRGEVQGAKMQTAAPTAATQENFRLTHGAEVRAVAFLDNGYLISGGADGRAIIWNLANQQMVSRLFHHRSNRPDVPLPVNSVSCALGRYIACAVEESGVLVWDAKNKQDPNPLPTLLQNDVISRSESVQFSADGRIMAATFGANPDKSAAAWEVRDGAAQWSRKWTPNIPDTIYRVALSRTAQLLAGGGSGRAALYMWELPTNTYLGSSYLDQKSPQLAFSSDDSLAVSQDNQIYITRSGQEQRTLIAPGFVKSLAFRQRTPSVLAAAHLDGVTLFDVGTGKTLRTIPGTAVRCVAFSPDGRTIAIGDSNDVQVWRIDS